MNTRQSKPPIQLLSDRILVKIDKPERQTHGLWIPETAERDDFELYRGTVIACGPGARDKYGNLTPVDVVPGDQVFFWWTAAYRAKKGKHGGEFYPDDDHCIMRETQIRAIIEEAA